MDKAFVKKVIAVVIGISLFVMVASLISLITEAVLADDVMLEAGISMKQVVTYIKWSMVAVICITVSAFVCYAFAYFGNKPVFLIISAAISFAIAICCIVFLAVIREFVLENFSSDVYAVAAEYFGELIQLAIPSVLVGAYFTVSSVKAFVKKEEAHDEEV